MSGMNWEAALLLEGDTVKGETAAMQLLARARRGDRAAFEQLYLEHRDHIYTLCFNLCGTQEEAQDLLQETFFKAYRGISRFRGEAQFSTWLHQIAVNLYRDKMRTKTYQLDLPEDKSPPDAEALTTVSHVRTTLHRLPPSHRIILALRFGQGLSYQEIAEMLHWSLSRVKVTLHRAKQSFKEAYSKVED